MHVNRRSFIGLISSAIALQATTSTATAAAQSLTQQSPAKYVMLFIGDGMGIPQRMSTEYTLKHTGKKPLVMNHLPHQVLTHTYSASSSVTDSAASGTAIACGIKTQNGVIGLNRYGKPVKSIATHAKAQGLRVGIVTTVTLNHATPAAFFGHRASRNDYYNLGLDLIHSNFDFFAGGAIAQAKKKADLYTLAQQAGYTLIRTNQDAKAHTPSPKKTIIAIGDAELPYDIDRNPTDIDLATLTQKAIQSLDNPKGFFLMVEGGKIDYACHQNDPGTMVQDTIAFDKAVQQGIAFYKKHPTETLLIVTADHETGGLALASQPMHYKSNWPLINKQKASAPTIQALLKKANKSLHPKILTDYFGFADKQNPSVHTSKKLLSDAIGLGWSSTAHSALPVLTSAIGTHADLFTGIIDNTQIPNIIKKAMQ